MPTFDIEIGENFKSSLCDCCGRESNVGHGFVYRDGDAYAVYYASWAAGHPDKKVSFALAIGKWDDDSTSTDRTCFGLEAYEGKNEILFRVIEPEESSWAKTDLLGEMISRKDALNHSLLKEVFVIAEIVVRNHDAIRQYLAIPLNPPPTASSAKSTPTRE